MNDEPSSGTVPSHIRLIALDVDGVLTDGTFLWDMTGNEYKRFCFSDVMGISLAREAGLQFAIISGEDNVIIDRLAAKLKITNVYKGARDKAWCMEDLLGKLGLHPDQVCYVGDDVNDVPVMRMVGFPVAVANANQTVRDHARLVSRRPGGSGAVREVIDLILAGRSHADRSVEPDDTDIMAA